MFAKLYYYYYDHTTSEWDYVNTRLYTRSIRYPHKVTKLKVRITNLITQKISKEVRIRKKQLKSLRSPWKMFSWPYKAQSDKSTYKFTDQNCVVNICLVNEWYWTQNSTGVLISLWTDSTIMSWWFSILATTTYFHYELIFGYYRM